MRNEARGRMFDVITQPDLARELGVTVDWLRRNGPKPHPLLGKRPPKYRMEDVKAWLDSGSPDGSTTREQDEGRSESRSRTPPADGGSFSDPSVKAIHDELKRELSKPAPRSSATRRPKDVSRSKGKRAG